MRMIGSGTEGFEPANGGAKNRCLTTWPRPMNPSIFIVLKSKYAAMKIILT